MASGFLIKQNTRLGLIFDTYNALANVGSVLGAGLIVAGLYVVLWGKGKEMRRLNRLIPSTISSELSNHAHAFEIVIPSPRINDDKSKDGGSINRFSEDIVCNGRVSMDDGGRELPERKDQKTVAEEEIHKAAENREDV